MSKLHHMLEPKVTAVHRLEVISATGRRRQFASGFKARLLKRRLSRAPSFRRWLVAIGLRHKPTRSSRSISWRIARLSPVSRPRISFSMARGGQWRLNCRCNTRHWRIVKAGLSKDYPIICLAISRRRSCACNNEFQRKML